MQVGFGTVDYSFIVPSSTHQPSKDSTQTSVDQKVDLQEEIKKQQVISELKRIDQKVKAHEMAHLATAGELAKGGASFQYAKGPDGRQYAIAGEVPIDVSPAKSPEETIRKMERVIAAALAPADPSPQDLKVATQAQQNILKATMELQRVDLYA